MAVTPSRGDHSGQQVKQLIPAGFDVPGAVGAGFRRPIDRALTLISPAQALGRELRSGAIAQQPLECGAIMGLDADTRVEGKVAPVASSAHVCGRLRVEQPGALERQPAAFHGSPIHTTRSSLTSVARTETCWTIILVDNMRIGGRLDITWMAS